MLSQAMRAAFASRVRELPERVASDPALFAVPALLFVASTGLTFVVYAPMSARGGMAMPGGLTMSMTWMRMPGQTWSAAAASFVDVWVVMMVTGDDSQGAHAGWNDCAGKYAAFVPSEGFDGQDAVVAISISLFAYAGAVGSCMK